MDLQPLYDIKERLEQAALCGVGPLGEDACLARAAQALQPLAGRNPVCAKMETALRALPDVPTAERGGALLDLLALVDAVLCTQVRTGAGGRLSALRAGHGTYREIPYGQLQPVLSALTSTGSARMETVQDAWEKHPEWFTDYRVLPALIASLKDSYAGVADGSAAILAQIGAPVLPLLKADFDPGGKQDMTRRVGVIAAIEKEAASPWLRRMLPVSKGGVRAAIFRALAVSPRNTRLMLKLARDERGPSHTAVLEALALQDGVRVREFWTEELAKNLSYVNYLRPSRGAWASDLVAEGLQARIKAALRRGRSGGRIEKADQADLLRWCAAAPLKTAPSMMRFWRWADSRMPEIEQLHNHVGQPLLLDQQLTDCLMDSLCGTGPGPLCGLCQDLFAAHKEDSRYLRHALIASLFTSPAAEVYETFSPYIRTEEDPPEGDIRQRLFQDALLSGLGRVWRGRDGVYRVDKARPIAEPLDPRWMERMTQAAVKTHGQRRAVTPVLYWENVDPYDILLTRLSDPSNAAVRAWLVPYLRGRMAEKGAPYTYTRWILQFGGSPRDILGGALAKNIVANRLYEMHSLLLAIAEATPAEEAAAILQEALDSPGLRPDTQTQLQLVIPYSIQQLQEGLPFPSWNEWYNLTKML